MALRPLTPWPLIVAVYELIEVEWQNITNNTEKFIKLRNQRLSFPCSPWLLCEIQLPRIIAADLAGEGEATVVSASRR